MGNSRISYFNYDGKLYLYHILKRRYHVLKKASVLFIGCTGINYKKNILMDCVFKYPLITWDGT